MECQAACIKLSLFIKAWYHWVEKPPHLIPNLFSLNEFAIRTMIGKYKNKYTKLIKLNLIERPISLAPPSYSKVYLHDSRRTA
ncbi:Uncharacterised protein [Vibrio cholerae]|nr:Uncharacterised protein [Vibrio cholerae]